jgi:outer membrane protein TolC
LSTYTWKPASEPYTLPLSLIPSTSSFATNEIDFMIPASEELIRDAISSHPELEIYKSKFKFLDIEKKLKFQELLPDVKIKYNQLGKSYSVPETIAQPLLQNNYQYALSLAVPLRLSQGRAGYKQAKLKITSTELQLDLKQRMIENKIREQLNTLSMLRNQLNIQENLYQSQAILLKGEEIRFQNGESSLFLINSREQKNIETIQKLNATIAKYYKQKASLKWATGNLYIVK